MLLVGKDPGNGEDGSLGLTCDFVRKFGGKYASSRRDVSVSRLRMTSVGVTTYGKYFTY